MKVQTIMHAIITSSLTFAISIDDKNTVKVWDIQEKACIQTILNDSTLGLYTALVALPFKDYFLIAHKSTLHLI